MKLLYPEPTDQNYKKPAFPSGLEELPRLRQLRRGVIPRKIPDPLTPETGIPYR